MARGLIAPARLSFARGVERENGPDQICVSLWSQRQHRIGIRYQLAAGYVGAASDIFQQASSIVGQRKISVVAHATIELGNECRFERNGEARMRVEHQTKHGGAGTWRTDDEERGFRTREHDGSIRSVR